VAQMFARSVHRLTAPFAGVDLLLLNYAGGSSAMLAPSKCGETNCDVEIAFHPVRQLNGRQ
jgi:hypothetical protein